MAVPILGAIPVAAPTFTLRVHRGPNMTIVEAIRDSDGVTVATVPFANEMWDQLFHAHDEPEPMTEDPHIASAEFAAEAARELAQARAERRAEEEGGAFDV